MRSILDFIFPTSTIVLAMLEKICSNDDEYFCKNRLKTRKHYFKFFLSFFLLQVYAPNSGYEESGIQAISNENL